MTGVDCRSFFHAHKIQRLDAQATLEDFLRSPAGFLDGVRYFWAHALE